MVSFINGYSSSSNEIALTIPIKTSIDSKNKKVKAALDIFEENAVKAVINAAINEISTLSDHIATIKITNINLYRFWLIVTKM